MLYQEIELFENPRDVIIPKIGCPPNEPEMTKFESAFLSGLLKKFKPKRILEVGLAAGGTSAIIMQTMDMLGVDSKIFSVDLFKEFYLNKELESGYLAEKAKELLPDVYHKRLLGKLAFEQVNEMGGDFDFLVLDTVHTMPGEILDFLAILPYLKNNAVVVLHDICCNAISKDRMWVNKLLLSSVTSNTKFMQQDIGRLNIKCHPNIGAFVIDANTRKYISDVFSALSITWIYMPEDNYLNAYREEYSKHYDDECVWLYDAAIKVNKKIKGCK